MSTESIAWFVIQAAAVVVAAYCGLRLGRASIRVWKPAAVIAAVLMLFWPLMRFFPARVIGLLSARVMIFIEVTGIVIPAVVLFAIAARHVRQPGERRLVAMLLPICCLYFLRSGVWMVRPAVPDLGPTRLDGQVCIQSTGYTCVAASLVTLLRAHGYEATETEMAHLSYTEVRNGATDSRAVCALETKLAGEPVDVRFEIMDYARLQRVPKPCVVALDWGYFVSHMVPVLKADDQFVELGDPLCGVRRLAVSKFLDAWHDRGIYLVDRRREQGAAN